MNRRILKKQRKNNILTVDMKSLPRNSGWDLDQWLEFYKTQHIVIWDSSEGGSKPFWTNSKAKIILKDISKNV